ncbi:MAG: hypothetical protein RBT47_07950, partial [Anaerolineae bacterium]|nr:hypothetical protein [Anaerolineae bacterium]
RRQGQTPEEAAAEASSQWREALAEWDLGPEQITHLRETADIALYTPGSRAGQPVDILSRFGTSSQDADDNSVRAQGLASALLGLAGLEVDPLQSREHILITTLIQYAWESGDDLTLPALIQMVQRPPIARIGVFDMESFFPQKERFGLALTLNNLIAAPGFALWREGAPLEIDRFLTTAEGKPRASIFYLAHLPEEQRHFFVTLFLEELRGWMRRQAGTKTLRALLIFDEIYGYLPPHPYNPPTKAPLLALVKQGRAAGLGIILSTQNPADVDYKGLSNIGTWFVGTLRTERDKQRVLEALEGALQESGMGSRTVELTLSGLKPRVFLMYDARAGSVQFLQSRCALSYLRGPLTPAEIEKLGSPTEALPETSRPAQAVPLQQVPLRTETLSHPATLDRLKQPPPVAPEIPLAFLPPTVTAAWAIHAHRQRTGEVLPPAGEAVLVYHPYLLGVGAAHIFNDKAGLALTDQQVWRVSGEGEPWALQWEQGEMISLRTEDLMSAPPDEGSYIPLPSLMGQKAAYTKWESLLKTHIYRSTRIQIWECPPLDLRSRPGEPKSGFLQRCRKEAARQEAEELRSEEDKVLQQAAQIEARLQRETLTLDQEEDELSERKREELLSGAETLLSLFSKRTYVRALSQTSRQRRYVQKAEGEIEESLEAIKHYREQLETLQDAWEAKKQEVTQKWKNTLSQLRGITLRAKKQDIEIRFCGLAWFPFWEITTEGQILVLAAYIPPSGHDL